jgi:hypothetical protein
MDVDVEAKRADFIANFSCPGCGSRTFKSEERLEIDRQLIQDLATMTGERISAAERIVPIDSKGRSSVWFCYNCKRPIDFEDGNWLDGTYFKVAWTDR